MRKGWSRLLRAGWAVIAGVSHVLRQAVGWEEVFSVLGLGALSYGSWLVYPPAGFIVAGLVLLWQALPPRPPFLDRPAPPSRSELPGTLDVTLHRGRR